MEPIKSMIPERKDGEGVLQYARRLKKSGFIPSEVMDTSLYNVALHLQTKERKEFIDELKAEHKCLNCEGRGVMGSPEEWHTCLMCQGTGDETAQEEDLAPQELEFREALRSKDVHKAKLRPDIIHRAFWFCQYLNKILKKEMDIDEMCEEFFKRVHTFRRKDGLHTYASFKPVWRYKELIELAKQSKFKTIDEPIPF